MQRQHIGTASYDGISKQAIAYHPPLRQCIEAKHRQVDVGLVRTDTHSQGLIHIAPHQCHLSMRAEVIDSIGIAHPSHHQHHQSHLNHVHPEPAREDAGVHLMVVFKGQYLARNPHCQAPNHEEQQ